MLPPFGFAKTQSYSRTQSEIFWCFISIHRDNQTFSGKRQSIREYSSLSISSDSHLVRSSFITFPQILAFSIWKCVIWNVQTDFKQLHLINYYFPCISILSLLKHLLVTWLACFWFYFDILFWKAYGTVSVLVFSEHRDGSITPGG